MATEDITFVQVDSRDLLDAVNDLAVSNQKDAPASASFYRNRALNLLWPYLTTDQRKLHSDYIESKEYQGPSKLIIDILDSK